MGNIIISLVLLCAVILIVRKLVRDKKHGKSSCCGNCTNCAMCSSCRSTLKK
ncbi:MAG: FeoB-associated Cys-rich membrane protein [Firmicutes bacterium]|nr:FeoB-associated Cys-rich membrane protein [Bacillota bacterium]